MAGILQPEKTTSFPPWKNAIRKTYGGRAPYFHPARCYSKVPGVQRMYFSPELWILQLDQTQKEYLSFKVKGEVGSAAMQPTSNRLLRYTEKEAQKASNFYFRNLKMAKKTYFNTVANLLV